uniref:Uncharacterized protein n=1 Tax=Oryzias melastigma TaxID=30732 RepID=A0A3B3DMT3_ORYME
MPGPSTVLAFLNVYTVRSEETESGICVFDCHGNPVGMSKAAGEKVKPMEDTFRYSRPFLHRTRLFQRNPMLAAPCRHVSAMLVFGLMIPVSFSIFPQLGTIKRENLEAELQVGAIGTDFFYHRGL